MKYKKTIVCSVILSFSFLFLHAQTEVKDTIYIIRPKNYKVDSITYKAYKEQPLKREKSDKAFVLYKSNRNWHKRPDEEHYGLIENKCINICDAFISKQELMHKKVRPLQFMYGILSSSKNIWQFSNNTTLYSIDESEFTNDSIKEVRIYLTDIFVLKSME